MYSNLQLAITLHFEWRYCVAAVIQSFDKLPPSEQQVINCSCHSLFAPYACAVRCVRLMLSHTSCAAFSPSSAFSAFSCTSRNRLIIMSHFTHFIQCDSSACTVPHTSHIRKPFSPIQNRIGRMHTDLSQSIKCLINQEHKFHRLQRIMCKHCTGVSTADADSSPRY